MQWVQQAIKGGRPPKKPMKNVTKFKAKKSRQNVKLRDYLPWTRQGRCTSTLHLTPVECNVRMVGAHSNMDRDNVPFDMDGFPIHIDNCSTATMSSYKRDFVKGTMVPIRRHVKGVGGPTSATHLGTIKWSWLDDDGMTCTHLLPNSYYVPGLKRCLMSPQHWAQTSQKFRKQTVTITTDEAIILKWNDLNGSSCEQSH